MEHYFKLEGQFRAKYPDDQADRVKLAINAMLTKAFTELEMNNLVSSTSTFMGPGWWFRFEEFNNNLHKETVKHII